MHFTKNQVVVLRVVFLAALAVAFLCSSSAFAQTYGVFNTTYFDNNGASGSPDAYIHVLNPGWNSETADGSYCADIYVWRADQELSECCSCKITPNGLLTFTVAAATANPGDGNAAIPASGSIDIISDGGPEPCTDATAADPNPYPTLRAWATHVNVDSATSGFDVTETAFSPAPLSTGEQNEAATRCAFIVANGSGAGLCDSICSGASASARTKTSKK